MPQEHDLAWWQKAVIYQIYVPSFMDGHGDGLGDLPGILSRLEYCRWLGVDAIWLTPFYPSPLRDWGYDISDHTAVHPSFGTLEDFDRLLAEAHRLGLKVILDYVPNHTSDEHPWFQASRSSRDNPQRDWYIWQDPDPEGNPPNNWRARFGGSAWEWDEATGQFYLHSYLKEQPDLNWRNPAVEKAMLDVLRFWLERGADGFRVDAVGNVMKDERLRDNPPNPDFEPGDDPYNELSAVYSADLPELHDVIARMRAVVEEYGDRVLIGEAYLTTERLIAYHAAEGGGFHFPFNFMLVTEPWKAKNLRNEIDTYESLLEPNEWPNWVLGNHDQPRVASRLGPAQARVAAMLLLTLRGTPTLYAGDELGLRDVPVPPEQARDFFEKLQPGQGLGRDPQRSPFPWSAELHAGFSTAQPWLPITEDYAQVNVEAQRDDPTSMLTLQRRLIQMRDEDPALYCGAYAPVPTPGETIAFLREDGERALLIALNLSATAVELNLGPRFRGGRILLTTHLDREEETFADRLHLRGDEGVIARVEVVRTAGRTKR